jgi:hypothetical protein
MEPQYSVFLYSKFSPNCKRIMDMMRQSGVDFGTQLKLQFLCIDNNQVRARVMSNESMDISMIPCILIVYPNGGVEKYEAAHAFKWVEEMISRLKPPPPPQPVPQPRPPVPRQRIEPEEEEDDYEEPPPRRQKRQTSRKPRSRRRMKPIQQQAPPPQGGSTVTSIDDLPMEEEEVDTMVDHQNRMAQPVRPQARVRRDRGNYEDEDIDFGGPPPTIARRPPGGAVKNKIQPTKANDASDVMAKAAAFAKMRDQDNATMRPAGEQMQNRP